MRTKVSIALLVVLLLISMMLVKLSLSAQEDNPPLSVSVQFLKDNAESIHDLEYGRPRGRKWSLESLDDCTLVWTTAAPNEALSSTGNSYIDNLQRERNAMPTSVTLSLSGVKSIKGNERPPTGNSNVWRDDYKEVYVNATPRRTIVKWRGGDGNRDDEHLILIFKSSEAGERYAQALRDAVKVCGKPDDEEEPPPNNTSTPSNVPFKPTPP